MGNQPFELASHSAMLSNFGVKGITRYDGQVVLIVMEGASFYFNNDILLSKY
jgi:hypothetical protein